jgi:hypothetical protein
MTTPTLERATFTDADYQDAIAAAVNGFFDMLAPKETA